MAGYDVRKVHECEFCDRQDERLGEAVELGAAEALAEADAGGPLAWRRFAGGFPLSAESDDGVWVYYIHETG
ncbi:hypothetical protein IU449_24920 [Nocardia higoensis]|uniref:Uncharacterized protein n=1 Tax=Nocardia higoensis TaxID=228599 RepID=A0ABS0DGZ9_9NOCA|nr:hypothetical protein [Nocardia higoensis]MBF6357747.1 hypothetical protein [Nocardia higoensis]